MLLASLLLAPAAYLLGSIPTGYLLVRIFHHQDIRTVGSGNIGATNVLRSGGMGLGAITFLLDMLKGCAAVWLGAYCSARFAPLAPVHNLEALAALCAVLGHMYPIWLGFRGGKGVATGFGVFLVAAPWAAVAAISVFALALAISRHVSLASILGAASFPVFAWLPGLRNPSRILHRCPVRRSLAHHRQASPEHPPPAGRHGIPHRSRKNRMSRIAVLGSGAWGTALALSFHRRGGHRVTLWAHSLDEAGQIQAAQENTLFLPGFPIPAAIEITASEAAVGDAEIVVSVIPSEFLRRTLARIRPHLHGGQIVVSATKGVEDRTFLRMSEVIAQTLDEAVTHQGKTSAAPERQQKEGGALAPGASVSPLSLPIGALSGPSFAREVAQGQPTAVTVAFEDQAIAGRIQSEFSSESLRLYTSTDVIGVELGGALKNVIAIAAGIAAGLGLGYNSAAALMTRGIAEITRLAVACGGRRETLAGLSGAGDLVLTCTGSLSRNRTVGEALGQGRNLPEILESLGGKVAEGVFTTRAALGLARQHKIEMPITEQMDLILNDAKDPREALKDLMLRPGKDEI